MAVNASASNTLQLATQAAQTITPGTSNKTIAAGRWLTGVQTIKGDSNLIAANIKSGKSIFGVSGSASQSLTELVYPAESLTTYINSSTELLGSSVSTTISYIVDLTFASNFVPLMIMAVISTGMVKTSYRTDDGSFASTAYVKPGSSWYWAMLKAKKNGNTYNFPLGYSSPYVTVDGVKKNKWAIKVLGYYT